ncbi:MAG: sulfite exporter TauE/SafE family protein [Gammaproteobacteria bacterium]
MEPSSLAIFSLAFGLGMLHALDADHIMAVTSLAGTRKGLGASRRYCLHWALGHGAMLLIAGVALFLLGRAIPAHVSHVAEVLVGVVLVVIGVMVVRDIRRKRAHIHFHQHDNLQPHAHWHRHEATTGHPPSSHRHAHKAVLFGMLHGLAGSAPLLALLPISQLSSPVKGLMYLLLFALGTLLSMLLFGGLLGGALAWLHAYGEKLIERLRLVIGMTAIVFGVVWIQAGL